MAFPISLYLSDRAINKLDAMVAKQAEIDKANGLEGRKVMSGSKMIDNLIMQYEDPANSLDLKKIEYHVVKLAHKYGAAKVFVFGSFARGEERLDSDVDILLEKGDIKGMQVFDFQEELSSLLDRKVDVVTTSGASDRFLKRINKDAILLYEAV